MPSVCAFVLTRDRKALLVECLRALRAQTVPLERIVVLDNASSDGTRELLEREGVLDWPELDWHRSERNTGGAGGYAEGIRVGLETGAEWLWLMDDDAEPRPDALERLLAAPPAQDPSTVGLASEVVHPDGTVDPLHRCRLGRFVVPLGPEAHRPGVYADVPCASFVGLLVRTDAARRMGLPLREFFIGYDDAEWSLRLHEHGEIRLVPESVLVHKIPVGGGGATRRSRFWNRVLGQAYPSSPWEGFWKDLYRVRNFVWLRRIHGGLPAGELALVVAAYVVKALMYDPQPLRRVPWIVRYALKGARGDFRALPPEAWRRRAGAA